MARGTSNESHLSMSRIGLSVVNGVVTLTAEVATPAETRNTERPVGRVAGVGGVINSSKFGMRANSPSTSPGP